MLTCANVDHGRELPDKKAIAVVMIGAIFATTVSLRSQILLDRQLMRGAIT